MRFHKRHGAAPLLEVSPVELNVNEDHLQQIQGVSIANKRRQERGCSLCTPEADTKSKQPPKQSVELSELHY